MRKSKLKCRITMILLVEKQIKNKCNSIFQIVSRLDYRKLIKFCVENGLPKALTTNPFSIYSPQ